MWGSAGATFSTSTLVGSQVRLAGVWGGQPRHALRGTDGFDDVFEEKLWSPRRTSVSRPLSNAAGGLCSCFCKLSVLFSGANVSTKNFMAGYKGRGDSGLRRERIAEILPCGSNCVKGHRSSGLFARNPPLLCARPGMGGDSGAAARRRRPSSPPGEQKCLVPTRL